MYESAYSRTDGRPLAEVVTEVKEEVRDFVETRWQLLATELSHKIQNSQKAAVYGAGSLVVVGTGFLLLTLALVGLIAVAFWGSPYAWFFAFLIVGVAWLSGGMMLALAARKAFGGITPTRTLEVLRKDKIWLESETRSQP
jgi:uncharacterized membrane protein YqjE